MNIQSIIKSYFGIHIPSGILTVCELENGPVEIADLSNYKIVMFHSYVTLYQGVEFKHLPSDEQPFNYGMFSMFNG